MKKMSKSPPYKPEGPSMKVALANHKRRSEQFFALALKMFDAKFAAHIEKMKRLRPPVSFVEVFAPPPPMKKMRKPRKKQLHISDNMVEMPKAVAQ